MQNACSACPFVLGCEGSLPELSVTWRNGGASKSRWHLPVFVTMSNYDTRGRQESERTGGMFCNTDSKAEKPSTARVNGMEPH